MIALTPAPCRWLCFGKGGYNVARLISGPAEFTPVWKPCRMCSAPVQTAETVSQ
jgi:hypothetical protein